jgi:hypothetical protein
MFVISADDAPVPMNGRARFEGYSCQNDKEKSQIVERNAPLRANN